MDKFKIDSHKLIYHPQRISDWLNKKIIYPVYLEISPSGSCNHRCVYCALDFMGYKPRFLEISRLKDRLYEMGKLGVKSIMYAGEGEPLLHKNISEIVSHTKRAGIDAALTSNGALFNKELLGVMLKDLTWIKISINAATEKTYSKIHRAPPGDLKKVKRNMALAAKIRNQKKYKCALGMQIVLLPENYAEVAQLAKEARDLGMDYLVVKPYSQHPLSKTKKYENIRYEKFLYLRDSLMRQNTDRFHIVFRLGAMKKWDARARTYKHCYALPFWAYIDSAGNVWACSIYLSKDKFRIGNIYTEIFQDIWEREKRFKLMSWVEKRLNTDLCRINCRMDEVNRYLWELKHLPEHVNFI